MFGLCCVFIYNLLYLRIVNNVKCFKVAISFIRWTLNIFFVYINSICLHIYMVQQVLMIFDPFKNTKSESLPMVNFQTKHNILKH